VVSGVGRSRKRGGSPTSSPYTLFAKPFLGITQQQRRPVADYHVDSGRLQVWVGWAEGFYEDEHVERNKRTVMAFYDLTFN
jgi:hypothetical protein